MFLDPFFMTQIFLGPKNYSDPKGADMTFDPKLVASRVTSGSGVSHRG